MIGVPFFAFFLDFAGWFLTKQDPNWVWLVLIGGILSCPLVLVGMAISLYQLWLFPRQEEVPPL
jgi:membrane protein insertase Oxa1/YidC/SpoIIIJ